MSIEEEPLDHQWILPNCFLISGKPRKGKSHMVKYLLLEFLLNRPDNFKFGLVFSSPSSIDEYDFITTKTCKIPVIDASDYENTLQNYIAKLLAIKAKGQPIPSNFIVFDDLVGLLNSNSRAFTSFITTFRKTNTSVFIATQYINKNISPTVRACINYAIMFSSKDRPSIHALYNAFGSSLGSESEFLAQFQKQAKDADHSAMMFIETEEENRNNFLSIQAPAHLPAITIDFDKVRT